MPRYFKDNPEGLKTLVDTSTPGYIYIGKALAATPESEEGWQLSRVEISAGSVKMKYTVENGMYFDSIWDNRASYTY